jgi:hypothetical protein
LWLVLGSTHLLSYVSLYLKWFSADNM